MLPTRLELQSSLTHKAITTISRLGFFGFTNEGERVGFIDEKIHE